MDPAPGFTAVLGNIATVVTIFVQIVGVVISVGSFLLNSLLPVLQGILGSGS